MFRKTPFRCQREGVLLFRSDHFQYFFIANHYLTINICTLNKRPYICPVIKITAGLETRCKMQIADEPALSYFISHCPLQFERETGFVPLSAFQALAQISKGFLFLLCLIFRHALTST